MGSNIDVKSQGSDVTSAGLLEHGEAEREREVSEPSREVKSNCV